MMKFLEKNRHNTAAIEKLTKQERDTNEKFEFKSEKIATRVRSFPSVLVCVLAPTTPSHVEKGPPTEPIEENDRKTSTCFRKKTGHKISRVRYCSRGTSCCGRSFAGRFSVAPEGIHKQVTKKNLLDDPPEKM